MSISEIVLWGTFGMLTLVILFLIIFAISYNRKVKKNRPGINFSNGYAEKVYETDPDKNAAIVGADPGHFVPEKYRGPNYDGPLTENETLKTE